ncbi:hypothetical protein GSI_04297 [Ganoderma sinense ZZ0214-1]|uniref:Uncharacterized protein n=1 Tax=Ganoderma sinense ZZ0214-1 TaxID=1077348 RepID=A0A2G8SIS0_9APHY|nr:hypothetical protein GSI_04297 [Ganoderma sinense ZZ0214-1]
MATYDGINKLSKFPSVLQLFCIPVSPHNEIQPSVEHLHTTPEWQKDDVWLLILAFISAGEVTGRWKWRNQRGKLQNTLSLYVRENELFELAEIQKRRWKEWSTKCLTEEGYLETCYVEYETSNNLRMLPENARSTSAASTASRTGRTRSASSRDTRRSGQDNAMPTIPEQELSDVENMDASAFAAVHKDPSYNILLLSLLMQTKELKILRGLSSKYLALRDRRQNGPSCSHLEEYIGTANSEGNETSACHNWITETMFQFSEEGGGVDE